MSAELQNSIYSAFLDGEASGEERTEVERRRQDSPEIGELLTVLRTVSTELQALPQRELPTAFPQTVLAAIASQSVVPVRPAVGDSWGRRVLPFAISAACVLAAAVALVNGGKSTGNRDELENNTLAFADDESRSVAQARRHVRTDAPMPRKRLAGNNADNSNGSPAKPSGNPVVAKMNKDSVARQGFQRKAPGGFKHGKLTFVDDLRKLTQNDIGRVVTALRPTPNGIAVVKLTVVDCNESTLHALELLLAETKIPAQAGRKASANEKADGSKRDNKPAETAPKLRAVYVQSTPDQMAKAIERLKRDARFQKLHVETPVAVASLDRATRHRLDPFLPSAGQSTAPGGGAGKSIGGGGDKSSSRSAVKAKPEKKNLAGAAPKQTDAKKQSGTKAKRRFQPPGDGSKIAEYERISRHLRLSISRRVLAKSAKRDAAKPGFGGIAIARNRAAGIGATAFGKKGKPAVPEPIRVLFVLICDEDRAR